MKRLLLLTTLALLLIGHQGHGQGVPEGRFGFVSETGATVYRNDDGLRVLSPYAKVRQRVAEPVVVGAGWGADIISSASVDVVTAATKRFDETRHEADLDVLWAWRDYRFSAAWMGSTENDTDTHFLVGGAEMDLMQRNLTLKLSYGLGLDRLGSVYESEEIWRDRTTHQLEAAATQLLGPATLASGTYSLQAQRGFLASRYRQVPLFPGNAGLWRREHAQWVPERHPDSRDRHALGLRLRHAFGPRLFAFTAWRGYLDTWSMRSHTAELGLGLDLGHGLLLELANRGYRQSSVSFYRAVYTVNREYLTRDRRLGKMYSDITRLDLRWVGGKIETLLRGELHWTRYDDFRTLVDEGLGDMPDTLGLVIQAAVALRL